MGLADINVHPEGLIWGLGMDNPTINEIWGDQLQFPGNLGWIENLWVGGRGWG